MRNLGIELTNHFSSEVITIATCWKLTRQDGLIHGFTDHDKKLIIDDIEYDSIAGFTPTNVESGSNLAVDNLDLSGQLYASRITETDLLAGKYDFAEVEIFLVNYQQPGMGRLIQKRGVLGEVTLSKNLFHAEIRGLTQFLSQTMCDTYLPHCRANLGDYRCGFDLNQRSYRVDSRVSAVIDTQTFIAEELTQRSDWFSGGYISWQSGSNKLLKMEVKEFASSKVVLSLPMAFNINIDDRFIIFAGCDKSSKTCQEKFDNIINFRGEPDLPGIDKLTNAKR